MIDYKVLKVCRKNNKPRLWIEGDFLLSHGWVKGDSFDLTECFEFNENDLKDYLTLTRKPNGKRKVSGRDRNNKHIPIIDITGRSVSMLNEYQKIKLIINENYILIKGVKNV